MNNLFELLAVACEEDDACPWSVSDTNNIAGDNLGTIWSSAEWLVIVTRAVGMISDGILVVAYSRCQIARRRLYKNRNRNIPGNLKRGYGLVAIPIAISVLSGLS